LQETERERERADLGIGELSRDTGVEVGQLLVFVASEDENLVLEERREPSKEPHPEILRLCSYLIQNVGVELGRHLLWKDYNNNRGEVPFLTQ